MMDTPTLSPKQARLRKIFRNLLRKPVHTLKTALKNIYWESPPPKPPQPNRPQMNRLPPPLSPTKPPGAPQPITQAQSSTTVLGTDMTDQGVGLTLRERFLGTFCIGATGTGKSTLDLTMILSDISHDLGIYLIKPYGDLTKQVIAAMPEKRLKDVIYLDITDSASSFGLNFFERSVGADLTEVAKIAAFVMHVFEKVWSVGPETPRLAQVLRNTTRVLIENPGMTFSEIPLLLWEDGVREKLVRRVTNTQTRLFWQQYNRKTPRDRDELIASTINKVDAYLNEPLKQHLDNLRRKDSLRRVETAEISVRLGIIPPHTLQVLL